MVNSYAIDHALPCRNPQCKEYGKPHYGCKCYGAAEGGVVEPFCSRSRPHQTNCPYYSEQNNILPGISATALQHTSDVLKDVLSPNPSEATKWSLGTEDKDEAIASALSHAGAYHLLARDMRGAYSDPNEGLRSLANQRIHKRLTKHMAQGGMIDQAAAHKITSGHPSKLAPVILEKMLSNNSTDGFPNLLAHANNIHQGKRLIKNSVDGVFSPKPSDEEARLDEREKLAEYMESGGLGKQIDSREIFKGSAPMERHFPEHNIMLQEAKGRVSNYLDQLRPVKAQSPFPFDTNHKNHVQERVYNEALDLANRPTKVFGLIKSGRLTLAQVKHLNSMYPQVADHYRQKLTERIIKDQLAHDKPSYQTRQALSLFLGAPMDSSLTQPSIQAAQMVFARQTPQPPQQATKGQSKKSTSKLDKTAEDNRTPDQAAQMRQLKV